MFINVIAGLDPAIQNHLRSFPRKQESMIQKDETQMAEDIIYSDSLVAITNKSIIFRRYGFFERDRMVLFSEIEKIVVKKSSFWNGKLRFHGTGDFKTWFPKDFQRYKRDKIFFAFIRYKWWRIGFTVENSASVIKIFRGKGLTKNIN